MFNPPSFAFYFVACLSKASKKTKAKVGWQEKHWLPEGLLN
jgi:hypothetical protein